MFGVQAWINVMLGSSQATGAALVPLQAELQMFDSSTDVDGPRMLPAFNLFTGAANNKPAGRLKVSVSSLSNVKEMMKG